MERCPWIDPVVLNHQLDYSVVRYLMLPTLIKLSVWTLVCSMLSMSVLNILRSFLSVGGVHVSISIPSDPPTAGESYTLECSTGGSQAERFQWLGPPDGRTPVVEHSPGLTTSSASTSSQLQFRPVQQSDNGSYSCSATVGGLTLTADPAIISVNGIIIPKCNIHYSSHFMSKCFSVQLPLYQSW